MKDYLPAFKVVSTHGIKGEMRAVPLCDGAEFLAKIKAVYPTEQGGAAAALKSVRPQGNVLLVSLAGVDSIEQARTLFGKIFYFAKADARLPKGRYFIDDLIGCEVRDADTGAVYGTVTAVEHPAAQDVYTVAGADGQEHMFPAVEEFVDSIDIAARRILVRPIAGMFGEAVNGDKE